MLFKLNNLLPIIVVIFASLYGYNCFVCNSYISNCADCDSYGLTCQQCVSGYTITLGICTIASNCVWSNCVSCNLIGLCTQCSSGYTVNSFGSCTSNGSSSGIQWLDSAGTAFFYIQMVMFILITLSAIAIIIIYFTRRKSQIWSIYSAKSNQIAGVCCGCCSRPYYEALDCILITDIIGYSLHILFAFLSVKLAYESLSLAGSYFAYGFGIYPFLHLTLSIYAQKILLSDDKSLTCYKCQRLTILIIFLVVYIMLIGAVIYYMVALMLLSFTLYQNYSLIVLIFFNFALYIGMICYGCSLNNISTFFFMQNPMPLSQMPQFGIQMTNNNMLPNNQITVTNQIPPINLNVQAPYLQGQMQVPVQAQMQLPVQAQIQVPNVTYTTQMPVNIPNVGVTAQIPMQVNFGIPVQKFENFPQFQETIEITAIQAPPQQPIHFAPKHQKYFSE